MLNTLIGAAKHLWNKGKHATAETQWKPEYGTLYDQVANDIDGNPYDFNQLRGKVCLVVNVACDCGYTKSGYTNMVEMHRKYRDQGFEVLAFPSNQFGQQESRPENEIKEYVKAKYGVEFPLFSKIEVNGENTHPLYQWLKKSLPGDITWNFAAKFIVNHEGIPVERLETEPWSMISNKIGNYIEAAKGVNVAAQQEAKNAAFFESDDSDEGEAKVASAPAAPAAAHAAPAPAAAEQPVSGAAPAAATPEAPAATTQAPRQE